MKAMHAMHVKATLVMTTCACSTDFVHKINGFAVEDAICPASGQNKGNDNDNDNDNNDNVQRSAAGWGREGDNHLSISCSRSGSHAKHEAGRRRRRKESRCKRASTHYLCASTHSIVPLSY